MTRNLKIKTLVLTITLLSLSFVNNNQVYAKKALTGLQIMKIQKNAQKAKTEYQEQSMLLIDKNGKTRKRRVREFGKETGKDIHNALITFLSPSNVKGTALLTWQNKKKQDDQWLYQPAKKKLQRISSASKGQYFMGTDLTYEDMQSEELQHFNYRLIKKEKLNGVWCYKVEAKPKTKSKRRESNYSKRTLWIHTNYFYTIQTNFYDKRGKFVKQMKARKFKNVGKRMWRPDETVMSNFKLKHKTVVKVTKRTVNKGIHPKGFKKQYLTSRSHM